MKIEYKKRLFGDVLHDIVYSRGDAADFVMETGINSTMLSNLMNHKKYPGKRTLNKVAALLPEEDRVDFVSYYMRDEVRDEGISTLKQIGFNYPYLYSIKYNGNSLPYTDKFSETDKSRLEGLQITGLFKYLSEDEKRYVKKSIIDYIVKRNEAIQKIKSVMRWSEIEKKEKEKV